MISSFYWIPLREKFIIIIHLNDQCEGCKYLVHSIYKTKC